VTFWPVQNLRTLSFIIVSDRNICDCDTCFCRGQAVGACGKFIVSTSSFYITETSVALHKFVVDGYSASRPHEIIFKFLRYYLVAF
jgi:hypothetical protein